MTMLIAETWRDQENESSAKQITIMCLGKLPLLMPEQAMSLIIYTRDSPTSLRFPFSISCTDVYMDHQI